MYNKINIFINNIFYKLNIRYTKLDNNFQDIAMLDEEIQEFHKKYVV